MNENKNCTNIKNCNSCNSCYYCDFCNYCNYCDFCNSCNSCNYCDFCNSCNSCNYCDFCYGLRMSEKMIFCLGDGKYESKGAGYQKNLQIFNTPVTEAVWLETRKLLQDKKFSLPITKWIEVKDIEQPTDIQKKLGRYLKTLNYHDAWEEMWAELSTENKNFFKTLPHFNSEIFEKITGIKVEDNSLSGKTVEVKIDGVSYKAIIE